MKSIFEVQKLVVVKEKSVEYEPFDITINGSKDIVNISRQLGIDKNAEEVFCMFCMNTAGHIIAFHEVSRGDLCGTTTHPREIFKRALTNNATALIFVHNHPSGSPSPSEMDITTTERLAEAGDILGVPVVDHVVLGDDEYVSMRAMGIINF